MFKVDRFYQIPPISTAKAGPHMAWAYVSFEVYCGIQVRQMALRQVSLDDKYEGRDGKVYITGTQSLVRAAMMQHLRDEADDLKTGCFISGYRGSPMHNLDKELWAGKRFLPQFDIHFLPAINEDLAPPILTKLNPETGLRDKRTYGPWIFGAMRLLARLKWLRGTPFDFCRWSGERRMERKLAADYIKHMTEVAQGLSHDTHALAVKLAGVTERIRGYGHVKERHLLQAEADRNALLDTWRRPSAAAPAAA